MATPSLHPLLHYLRRLSGGTAGGDVEDAQLLRRFLNQRDESAFTTIVQRYGAMVWALCVRRLGETPEAEDAFQATFLVLVRKARSLRGPELLGPWLYGVAYRTALKLRGRRARLAARETTLPEQAAEERPERVWSDLRPILDEEVNRLPEKYRQPVLLCYLQGLSSEEAARRLGCAKGTIFSQLSRARDLLRRRLSKRGLGVSSGVLAAVLTENAAARSAPPAILCASTIRTSLSFAAGTANPALSAPLAALVEGVLRSMFLSKVRFVVIVLLALGLVGSGAGFIAHRTGAEQPVPKSAPAPILPAAVADKAKKKDVESQPDTPPPAVVEQKQTTRSQELRRLLDKPVQYEGLDDPQVTLQDALEQLAKRYNLPLDINEHAFKGADIKEVRSFKIITATPIPQMHTWLGMVLKKVFGRVSPPATYTPIPQMNTRLGTVLKKVLSRVSPSATYIIRDDFIEITTVQAIRKEFFANRPNGPFPPLVTANFEKVPLEAALKELGRSSNVVLDSRAAKEGQTSVKANLVNVPLDTAVRLLANMAGLSMVRLDDVFYVTTAENAKQMREEQAKINLERLGAGSVPDKSAK
jgi:RNA polymerase sigma factor (sigma-70 family)